MEIQYLPSNPEDSPVLCHYGIPRRSGRYKWGSGNRPYQSLEGQGLTRREKRQQTKEEKAVREKARKEASAEREKQIYEEERKRVLTSGGRSATDVLRYSSSYSNQELANAVARVRMTKELEKMAAEEKKTFMKDLDKFMKGVDTFSKYGESAVKAATTVKKILDLLEGEEDGKKQSGPFIKISKEKKKGS